MGKTWTEEDVKQALEEVKNCSVSIRATAKKYGMTEGTIRNLLLVEVDPQHLIKMLKRNRQNAYLLCVN